jgi:FKBP-type peptidyl-prolyl cis-trans isomerase
MNTVSTGIAVALALGVMAFIFLPGLLPFHGGAVAPQDANGAEIQMATTSDGTTQAMGADGATTTNTTSMTPEPAMNVTELQVKDVVTGTGPAAKAGDSVTVNYVGMLTSGKVFDASANHGSAGFTFTLGAGQVIKGWDQGVAGMKVGGKRELVIPASLAYGSQAVGGVIPANSTLIFEVELTKIGK